MCCLVNTLQLGTVYLVHEWIFRNVIEINTCVNDRKKNGSFV